MPIDMVSEYIIHIYRRQIICSQFHLECDDISLRREVITEQNNNRSIIEVRNGSPN